MPASVTHFTDQPTGRTALTHRGNDFSLRRAPGLSLLMLGLLAAAGRNAGAETAVPNAPALADDKIPMCELARDARQKNSQSAAVLEEKCRALGGTPSSPAAPPENSGSASTREGRSGGGRRGGSGRGGPGAAPGGPTETTQSFRDWEGTWDLRWEYQGQSYTQVMTLKPTQTALFGDYVLGVLEGQFAQGDFSRVTGDFTNTTNTGVTCRSGKQGGSFSLTLAKDGGSINGWWDVCGEGQRWRWSAVKRAGTPGGRVDDVQSSRDWEGSWNLVWEYQGKSYSQVMTLKPTQTRLFGDYVLGVLEGQFAQGDFSRVTGDFTNTTNTGVTCRSGKQGGSFSLTLARDGRSIYGWWDVCGEGQKWSWKADKR